MRKIAIISSSVRQNRTSHRLAEFVKEYIESNNIGSAEILDLKEYNFPLFDERLMFMKDPSEKVLDYVERFTKADAIIILSPVYNQSFPAALKNAIDLLYSEWRRKVVGLITATSSKNPGINTYFQLENILLRLGAVVTPTKLTAVEIGSLFDEEGRPIDENKLNRQVGGLINDLIWMMDGLVEDK